MKTIIASVICAVVAIGCLELSSSKVEAGWYGRGVGVSVRIGPRYGYYGPRYGYYGYRYRPYGYYGYRRYGYYGYRPHRGYWAGRAWRRWH